jgi:DNA-binding Lrp family transcriptional regulator|tara:strand:+ start:5379 stop:5615 length:237 start_codon:yes stop_codon:yes gene_type:complete
MHFGFVLLNCDLGTEEYILDELKQIEQVKNAYVTFGAYDIIAEIHANDQEEFEKTVSMKIRRLSRIVSTMTLNVVKSG